MTELRLTRRRLLGAFGGTGAGVGALYAVPPRRVSASLTTYEYLLSVREHRPHNVDEFTTLEAGVRGPVRQAIEGSYETDDPPDALREYFDDSIPEEGPVVHYQGGYYRLSASLPVYVVRLVEVSESEADDPLTMEELGTCISGDSGYREYPPARRSGEPARVYHLDERFRRCVERHPYLEDRSEFYRWEITVEDPGAPHWVRAEEVSARELAGVEEGTVGRWESLSATVRETLDEAEGPAERGSEPGAIGWNDTLVTNSLPGAVVAAAEQYDYVRRGDAFIAVGLSRLSEWPLSVEVAVTDPITREFDPAWLELSLSHDGEEPVEVRTQAPVPFGTLWARWAGEDRRPSLTLWSPEYGEPDHDHTFAGRIEDHSLAAHRSVVTFASGQTATGRYAVRRNPGRLATGEYRVPVTFGMSWPDADPVGGGASFPAVLTLDVEKPE